jgi:hypothetical protein
LLDISDKGHRECYESKGGKETDSEGLEFTHGSGI